MLVHRRVTPALNGRVWEEKVYRERKFTNVPVGFIQSTFEMCLLNTS